MKLYLTFFLVARRLKWLLWPFCPKILGRWHGPTNEIFLVCEYRLSSLYTNGWWEHSNLSCYNQIHMKFLCSEVVGMLKHCCYKLVLSNAIAPNEPPSETFTA